MKYLILLSILLLSACGHTPDEIVVTKFVYVDVICEKITEPSSIKARDVEFVEATTTDGYKALGLRGDQYSNLSINSANTLRFIRQQNDVIDHYKNCIKNHNDAQKEGEL